MRLQNKVAIITGASGEIGIASALIFAQEGARVVAADIQTEAGEQAIVEIRKNGGEGIFQRTDITSAEDVRSLVENTLSAYGRIDVLFNNAGIVVPKQLLDTSDEEFERLINVNLKGAFLCIKQVLPHMIVQGSGSIINTASSAGVIGRPGMPVYGASKGGLVALTRGAAVAYGPSNVRVNAIVPGSIWTEMTRRAFSQWSDLDEQKRSTEKVIPLRRIGEAEDIAYAALFLASDESKYITGAILPVDGGRTAGIAEAASS